MDNYKYDLGQFIWLISLSIFSPLDSHDVSGNVWVPVPCHSQDRHDSPNFIATFSSATKQTQLEVRYEKL